MDAERWRRVEELFDAASRLTPAERVPFLDQSCGGDRALRAEVESLLTYQTSAEAFIEAPAIDVAARLMTRDRSPGGASLSGATIAHFRILEKLGEGGMGVVYAAEDTRLGRTVALKFLPPAVSNPRALERFEREARAASALNHPNICTIYSVQDDAEGGRPFIEMERLEGHTLRERIGGRPLAIDEVVSLALQMIDGLDAAHAKGIVHRDLKPGNVFCTERGVAKILDFGVAKLESVPEADRGAVIGTVAYMSPEQASGQAVDSRTDLFSLGAVLYEMATGRAAFQGPSSASIRRAILETEPIAPRRLNPKVPAALERIIVKALAKDRDLRYQRASELRTDLERLRGRGGRRRQQVLAAAVVLLLLGTVALWYSPLTPADMFSTNLRLRQITHNASEYSVGSGALSPDGRLATYADSRGMHVTDIDTGATRKVPASELPSASAVWDLTPGWFPDGTGFVVNLMTGADAAASSVWLVGVSGEPRKLRDHARALSISPDGSWIGFASDGTRMGDRNIWVMDRDGAGARKLFDADAGSWIVGLSWSPDARRVAYLRADDTRTPVTVETRELTGGPVSTIVRPGDAEELQGLTWLRDGRLLYSLRQPAMGTSAGRTPCSHWQLRLGPTGRPLGAARPMAGWLPGCVTAVTFNADGTRAMFRQWSFQDTIHVADLDAGGRVASSSRLTFTEGRNIPSGWTADGKSVVFVSDGAGRVAVVRTAIGSDTPQPIAEEPGIVGAARMTPDGASVLYLVQPKRGSTQQVMSVPVTGGVLRSVVAGRFVDGGARCAVIPATLCAVAERSPDGRQIVFTSIELSDGRGRELVRFDAEPEGDYRWALSPDGARIAVLNARAARILVLSLTGLTPLDLHVAGRKTLGYVSWSADGKGLVVPSVDARAATLLMVDLQGNTRVLWQQPGAIDISGIPSPDGRRIAVWVRSRAANLWLAESP
jgi:Tol biopolymer transport system component